MECDLLILQEEKTFSLLPVAESSKMHKIKTLANLDLERDARNQLLHAMAGRYFEQLQLIRK
jgi:hypothetical protein